MQFRLRQCLPLLLLLLFSAQASAQKGLGAIAGQVLTPTGEPAAGLRIAALEASADRSAQGVSLMAGIAETDGEGRFRLEDIPVGRYYLVVGRIDNPIYYPGVRNAVDAKAIVVTAGGTVSGIVFTAVPILTVRGRIEAPDEFNPFPTTIQLRSAGEPGGIQSVISADSFEFRDVAPGEYTVTFGVQTGSRVFQIINGGGQSFENRIVVTDRSINDVIVSFGRPVGFRVLLDRRGPMPPFTLSFAAANGASFQASASRILPSTVSLPMDEYRVRVSEVPVGFEVQSILYGDTDILRSPLKIGTVLNEIVVNVAVSDPPPWFRVGGRVTGEGSPPTPNNMSLRLIPRGKQETTRAPLQPDGSFQFEQVLPGAYDARIEPAIEGLNPILIQVPERDLSGIEILLPGRSWVQGRVVAENAAAIPPLRIALVGTEASVVPPSSAVAVLPANPELTLSPQGVFWAVVPNGEYRVVVRNLDIPYAVGSFTSGPVDLLRDTLKVGAGDTQNLALVLSIPGFIVSGHVYAASDGNSSEGPRIALSGQRIRETLYAVPGPDSAFRFPAVPSGIYALNMEPGGHSSQVFVNREDVTDLDLVFVRGRVIAPPGASVAGVKIWFSSASDPLSALTEIRDDGAFTVALTPGAYRVQLSVPSGYVLKTLTAGSVDLTEETLAVSADGPRELRAVFDLDR